LCRKQCNYKKASHIGRKFGTTQSSTYSFRIEFLNKKSEGENNSEYAKNRYV